MRRRFGFAALLPAQGPTKSVLRRWLTARKYPQRVADLHLALNAAIDDPGFQIGPSYFMRPAVRSDGGLAQVFRQRGYPVARGIFASVIAPWISKPDTALLLWRRA
ncbi:MAG: hypothetical protein L0H03_26960 [Rhodococcus sp. (in: high G+C Gram-positive bacteria)]|nr:hypothetical protein [Rhodococcus sp. (in: high G+C Gram-positive bacteria)]